MAKIFQIAFIGLLSLGMAHTLYGGWEEFSNTALYKGGRILYKDHGDKEEIKFFIDERTNIEVKPRLLQSIFEEVIVRDSKGNYHGSYSRCNWVSDKKEFAMVLQTGEGSCTTRKKILTQGRLADEDTHDKFHLYKDYYFQNKPK